jgi:endonuclease III
MREIPEEGIRSAVSFFLRPRIAAVTCSSEMPRETKTAKTERTAQIIKGLQNAYPSAHCELNFTNPLELLIATILSAQCTDKQVNIVTADLFQKYRTAADYANADLLELENDIRRIGLYRNKARNIKACCMQLVARFGGAVPKTMEELISLEGVGRKTANVVLGNAFNINEGVVVDTHVARLAQRLGVTREEKPDKIETELMNLVPREHWTLFSHWLIWHGRRRCFARGPQCTQCEVRDLCPSRDLDK